VSAFIALPSSRPIHIDAGSQPAAFSFSTGDPVTANQNPLSNCVGRTPKASAIIFKVRRVMLWRPDFEAVEARSIQTGEFRKLILGDALLLSEFLDVPADPEIDVLRCPRVESYAAPLHPA
jgi:hypothetical protein